jgi:hypothetical protein
MTCKSYGESRSAYAFDTIARGDLCPHRLRIYANYPAGIDFSDAEDTTPHHDMALLENEDSATEYPLRVSAFTSVNSLTLFFVSCLTPLCVRKILTRYGN